MLNKGLSIVRVIKKNCLKISAISIMLIMLISVVLIKPEKEKVNDENKPMIIDYTIRYAGDLNGDSDIRDSGEHRFYRVYYDYSNNEAETVERMTDAEVNALGIDYSSTSGQHGFSVVDGTHYALVEINNLNIKSKQAVAFETVGNVSLSFKTGNNYSIESSYIENASGHYGIKATGGLVLSNRGQVSISCANNKISGSNDNIGIYCEKEMFIFQYNDYEKGDLSIEAKGRNGVGIYSKNGHWLYVSGGTLDIVAGDCGNVAAIKCNKKVEVKNVNIGTLKATSSDGTAYGIICVNEETASDVDDVVLLKNVNISAAKVESSVKGSLIEGGKVEIYDGFNLKQGKVLGGNVTAIRTKGVEGDTDSGILIKDNANINIIGDNESIGNNGAICAENADIYLGGAEIKTTAARAICMVGNTTINVNEETENSIVKLCDNDSQDKHVIYANNNLNIVGEGKLDLELRNKDADENYRVGATYVGILALNSKLDIQCKNININIENMSNEIGTVLGVKAKELVINKTANMAIDISGNIWDAVLLDVGQGMTILGSIKENIHDVTCNNSTIYAIQSVGDLTIGEETNSLANVDINIANCSAKGIYAIHNMSNVINIYDADILINMKKCNVTKYCNGINGASTLNIKNSDIDINIIDCSSADLSSNGIILDGGTCILEDTDLDISNINEKKADNTGYGIKAATLDVDGGNTIIKSKGTAIYATTLTLEDERENEEFDPITDVFMASVNVDGSGYEDYAFGNLNTYKYVHIDEVYNYALKYNASTGTLYKVVTGQEDTPIGKDDLPGWDISDKLENNTYALILKGLDFATIANIGLQLQLYQEHESEVMVIELAENTHNRLYTKGTRDSSTRTAGIKKQNYLLSIRNSGKLDIKIAAYNSTSHESVGIMVKELTIHNSEICIDTYDKKSDSAYILPISNICAISDMVIENAEIEVNNNISNENMAILESIGNMYANLEINNSKIYAYGNNMQFDLWILGYNSIINQSDIKINSKNKSLSDARDFIIESGTFGPEEYLDIFITLYRKAIQSNYNTSISGGNIEINYTGDTTYTGGIYSYNSGNIAINDANIEINAETAMNVTPTLTNCGISEAKAGQEVFKPGNPSQVTSYNYVRIGPNYYLRFDPSDGKMYINNTSTPSLVEGWRPEWDETYGVFKLILDGFEFTTTNIYGLLITGIGIIEVEEGSNNTISVITSSNDITATINARDDLYVRGTGMLNINNYSYGNNYANGIFSTNYMKLDSAKLNVLVTCKKGSAVYSGRELDIVNKSDIYANLTATDYEYDDYYEVYSNYSYLVGATGNMNINKSKVNIICNMYGGYGIANADGILNIEDSEIDITAVADEFYGVGVYYGDENWATGRFDSSIANTEININVTHKDDENSRGENKIYGVYSFVDKLTLLDIKYDADFIGCDIAYGIYSYCGMNVSNTMCLGEEMDFTSTDYDIDIYGDNGEVYGIYAVEYDYSICNMNIHIHIDGTAGYSTGIMGLNDPMYINNSNIVMDIQSTSKTYYNADYDETYDTCQFGIYNYSDITIENSRIEGNMDAWTVDFLESYYGKVTIKNTDIIGESINSEYDHSYVIYGDTGVDILDDSYINISFESSETDEEQYIINADDEINIESSEIYVQANMNKGYVVFADEENIDIEGSNITANITGEQVAGIFVSADNDDYIPDNSDKGIIDIKAKDGVKSNINLTITKKSDNTMARGISTNNIAKISDSDITMTLDGKEVEGIYASENININRVTGSINVGSSTSAKGMYTQTASSKTSMGDSSIDIYAGGTAIDTKNLELGKTKEMTTEILEASTAYKNIAAGQSYGVNDKITYPGKYDASYKYVKLGNVNGYSYKFDVDNGEFSKVYTDGTSEVIEDVPGKHTVAYADGEYTLQLENFTLFTTAPIAIDVFSASNNNTKVGNIEFIGDNTITLLEGYNTYVDLNGSGIDNRQRTSIYAKGLKELNVLGSGTYTFVPINKDDINIVQHLGIATNSILNFSLNNYNIYTPNAYRIMGIYVENNVNLNNVNYYFDINNIKFGVPVYAAMVNINDSTLTIEDSDITNTSVIEYIYGVASMIELNMQRSTIDIDIAEGNDQLTIIGVYVQGGDCNIIGTATNKSVLDMDIQSAHYVGGIVGQDIIFNNVIMDFDATSNSSDYIIGIVCNTIKSNTSLIDISIKNGPLAYGIQAMETWTKSDDGDDNNDYSIIDMKDTNLTIDLEADKLYGFMISGNISEEDEENIIEQVVGEVNFDGGRLVLKSKGNVTGCINAMVDKVSIRNVEYMEIHNNTDITATQAMQDQAEAFYESASSSGDYTADELEFIKEMYVNNIGYAIFAKNVEIYNTTGVVTSNFGSAIYASKKCNVKGGIQASENYGVPNTTPSGLRQVIDLNSNFTNYKYVEVEPTYITVDITWGALNYNYDLGAWDPGSLKYAGRGWEAVDGDGNLSDDADKITIVNRSNVPVNATYGYTPESPYSSYITGKLVKDRVSKDLVDAPTQILSSQTKEAYLVLDGKPQNNINKATVGKVTVSLTE